MDGVAKLSRIVVLGGAVVLLIISFFDWQQASGYGLTIGYNEWHGIGIFAALLVIGLVAWEVQRLVSVDDDIEWVSVALALLAALFTVISFFNKSPFRHWPAWIALIVAIVVGAAAVIRAWAVAQVERMDEIRRASVRSVAGHTDPADGSFQQP